MLQHPQFDPVAISIGPIAIHWYGLMYLFGFFLVWALGTYRSRLPNSVLDRKALEDLLFYSMLGVVLGGRLGYVLFYRPDYYLQPAHWLEITYLWEGGMSFHGGLIGVLAVFWIFSRQRKIPFLAVSDFIAPMIPLGLAAGRLGNFINGELWGRESNLPWAMVFPHAHDNLLRHPSQLYQMLLEGIILFIILWIFSRKPRPLGQVSGLFLIGYSLFRFLAEFTREPDSFLGYFAEYFTMGQLLSIPMFAIGMYLFYRADKSRPE